MTLDESLVVALRPRCIPDFEVFRDIGVEQIADGRRLAPLLDFLRGISALRDAAAQRARLVARLLDRQRAEPAYRYAELSALGVPVIEHERQHAALKLLKAKTRKRLVPVKDRLRHIGKGVDIALRQIDRRPLIWTTSRRSRTTFGRLRQESSVPSSRISASTADLDSLDEPRARLDIFRAPCHKRG